MEREWGKSGVVCPSSPMSEVEREGAVRPSSPAPSDVEREDLFSQTDLLLDLGKLKEGLFSQSSCDFVLSAEESRD